MKNSNKVILINPPGIMEEIYGGLYKAGGNTLPFGLAALGAVIENAGYVVEIIDCLAEHLSQVDLYERLSKTTAFCVGISCNTPQALRSFEAAKVVRRALPDCEIIAGGPHPSQLPQGTLNECPQINSVIFGEGEETFVDVLRRIRKGASLEGVPGVAFREGDSIKINQPREYIRDLDKLPFAAYHLFDMKKYFATPMNYRRLPTYSFISSRGCPHKCAFCSNKVFGNKFRAFSARRVIDEIKFLKEKYGAKGIIFYDDTFLVDRKRVYEICDLMHREKLKLYWCCLGRVDQINKDLLETMKKAGCWQISYGIESGSQRLLDLIGKDITIEQIKKAVKMTHKAGIQIRATFMLGLPTERLEETKGTIAFAKELGPEMAGFCITIPYPQTRLYEMAKETGVFRSELNWTKYNLSNLEDLVFVPDGMQENELVMLYRYAWRTFYFSWRTILRNIRHINSAADIRRYFIALRAILALNRSSHFIDI